MPALKEDELLNSQQIETSAEIKQRVEQARQLQIQRQGKANNELSTKEIETYCMPEEAAVNLLKQAITKLNLSARAYHRILKVARTISDLAGSKQIQAAHIAEAVQYRRYETQH